MIKQETIACILLFMFVSFLSAPLLTSVSDLKDQVSFFENMPEEETTETCGKKMADSELIIALDSTLNGCLNLSDKNELYYLLFSYSYMHLDDIFQPPKYSC